MKKLLLATAFFGLTVFNLPASANVNATDTAMVNACAGQMVDKNLTDPTSAQKVCTCLVDEQAKITQAQKSQIDAWVKSGKDVRQSPIYQSVSAKFKACGNGVKFNTVKK